MKKLIGFALMTPIFFGLAFGQGHLKSNFFDQSPLVIAIAVALAISAIYGMIILDDIYTEERKRDKQ